MQINSYMIMTLLLFIMLVSILGSNDDTSIIESSANQDLTSILSRIGLFKRRN